MFTLPGSQVAEGKQVLVMDNLILPYGNSSPLSWRMDGPMRSATRAKRLWKIDSVARHARRRKAAIRHVSGIGRDGVSRPASVAAGSFLPVLAHLHASETPLEEGILRTRLAQLQLGQKVTLPLAA
jgi:hypothetical protein